MGARTLGGRWRRAWRRTQEQTEGVVNGEWGIGCVGGDVPGSRGPFSQETGVSAVRVRRARAATRRRIPCRCQITVLAATELLLCAMVTAPSTPGNQQALDNGPSGDVRGRSWTNSKVPADSLEQIKARADAVQLRKAMLVESRAEHCGHLGLPILCRACRLNCR